MTTRRAEPKTHDYTVRRPGHDYAVHQSDHGGHVIKLVGWGHGLRNGDYILLQHPVSKSTRYRIENIEYKADPSDMWFALCTFAPRPQPQPADVRPASITVRSSDDNSARKGLD